jgi:hypothetical protein
VVILDAARPPEAIHADVLTAVEPLLQSETCNLK